MTTMPKITPFLWFDAPLDEPIAYYQSIFESLRVISKNPMSASFEIEGQRFLALNGGPQYRFNEAISLFIDCEDQQEVDYYWERLTADGGEESMCGWLKDKYGLSWQVIPKALVRYLSDPDRAKADRVTQAMLRMKRIDVAALERAAAEA
jgi:predicted 3-demethylubiquinone-9 3-methyltransferase (glyoxalase superfamily)